MDGADEILTGGNVAESVVRVGGTVRKPATPATPSIESLLVHLHSMGFSNAPHSLGRDDEGRHVLGYIPGVPANAGPTMLVEELRRVGQIIRRFHDASSSFRPASGATWNVATSPDGEDLICHNDLAPWNLIRNGETWVFIDWDGAGPGTRHWDLSYAMLTFPPIEADCDLIETSTRIAAILLGYGLDSSNHRSLIGLMIRRARAMYDLLVAGGRTGQQPWARLYADGHAVYWGSVADFIESQSSSLELAMSRAIGT